MQKVGVNIQQRIRINNAIRAPKVRLIDEDGGQLGVVGFSEALLKAEASGLDLVEVASNIEPPVCKIMDFGKYKYEQEKKIQKSKKSQKNQEIKGIRLSVKIGQNDLDTKLKKAMQFLGKGNKVALQLRFKGREMAHKELGEKVLRNFVEAMGEVVVEQEPKMLGRGMNMVVAPKKQIQEKKQEVTEEDKNEKQTKNT